MAQQAGSNLKRAKPKPSSTTQPRGPEVAGSPPQIFNPSKIRANPGQIRIQLVNPSIPSSPETSPAPSKVNLTKKPQIHGQIGPQIVRIATVLLGRSRKRDATFFQPKHGRTKPEETLRFSDQNTGKPSQTKATGTPAPF